MIAVSARTRATRSSHRAPQDLTEHNCNGLRLPTHGGPLSSEFKRRGKSATAHVTGRLVFNSTDLIVAATLAGHGLTRVPDDAVDEHIAGGRLVPVLTDWAVTYPGYHLYYARRNASPALSLVVDALRYVEAK